MEKEIRQNSLKPQGSIHFLMYRASKLLRPVGTMSSANVEVFHKKCITPMTFFDKTGLKQTQNLPQSGLMANISTLYRS